MVGDNKATISFSDGSDPVELPVLAGTDGPDVIDIRSLYGATGKFTYDPGFLSTASCQSNITFIDGDKGILLYRGYPIEQLALECDLEVCFLLQNGELPNALQKDEFEKLVKSYSMVHESMAQFMNGYPRNAHPMAVLTGLIGGMGAFYPDSLM